LGEPGVHGAIAPILPGAATEKVVIDSSLWLVSSEACPSSEIGQPNIRRGVGEEADCLRRIREKMIGPPLGGRQVLGRFASPKRRGAISLIEISRKTPGKLIEYDFLERPMANGDHSRVGHRKVGRITKSVKS